MRPASEARQTAQGASAPQSRLPGRTGRRRGGGALNKHSCFGESRIDPAQVVAGGLEGLGQ
jgi:hypothetical protein